MLEQRIGQRRAKSKKAISGSLVSESKAHWLGRINGSLEDKHGATIYIALSRPWVSWISSVSNRSALEKIKYNRRNLWKPYLFNPRIRHISPIAQHRVG